MFYIKRYYIHIYKIDESMKSHFKRDDIVFLYIHKKYINKNVIERRYQPYI